MASIAVAGYFSSFCLVLLACSFQAQARGNEFFSKATRYDTAKEASPAKEELPPVKKEEPVQYVPDNGGNGYGLYGHGPEKLPAAATANPGSATYNYNNGAENFNTENVPSGFSNDEFTGVSYQSKEFNGFAGNENYGNAGSIPETEFNSGSYYKYNKEPKARYPSYANQREQYGMSDTRYLDNGKYFYDLKAEESYRNGEYNPTRGNPRAYESFGGAAAGETFANGGYGFGNSNKGNGYEESTPTQGYQNNKGNTQEEYAP